jgi:diguanylate cyclase (GGDEF)-like protein
VKRISVENITDAFTRALAAGDEKTAWAVVNRALGEGLSVTEAYEVILLPALTSLSHINPSESSAVVEALEQIIERLQPHLPAPRANRPHAMITVACKPGSTHPLLGIRARALTDLLECDGWQMSLAAGSEATVTGHPLDALVVIASPDATVKEIADAALRCDAAHNIVITESGHFPLQEIHALTVADEYHARLALKELLAANASGSAAEDSLPRQIALSFESSDVLLCILDEEQKVVTANRIARDQFGFVPGEPVVQYLDKASRDMFAALLMNNAGLATELVEVGFLRHGQSYLADILLMPCGNHRAMLAYPKQEEIERLTRILNNYNREINKLNRELRDLRGQMKQQAGALEGANAQLGAAFTEIKDSRIEDPLTGAFNKKYYTVNLVNEINRARRYQRSLGFLLIGIDGFEKIVSELGHAPADEILKTVVRLIMQNTRRGVDWVARVSEHEFVVVLPETDMEGCLRVGEKLRNLVAGAEMQLNGKRVRATISVGGASYDAMQDVPVSFQELTTRADRALGRARREGPNRQNIEPLE